MSDHEMEWIQSEELTSGDTFFVESRLGFVKPSVLSEETLPTKMDILKRVCLAYDDKLGDENKSEPLESFIPNIVDEVVEIWKKTKIPIMSEKGIILKMRRLIEDYKKKKKNKNRDGFKAFCEESEYLFDIARCKCVRNSCKCIEIDKIPKEQIHFIFDQRGDRILRLFDLPEPATFLDSDFLEPIAFLSTDCTVLPTTENELSSCSEYIPAVDSMKSYLEEHSPKTPYNRHRAMPNLATECDRYGISNRIAAALVSAAFKDYDVRDAGQPVIIDRSKIERERLLNRRMVKERTKSTASVIAFSFDGRTDKTKILHRTPDGKFHPRVIKEKHISVLQQPNSKFLGYIADLDDKESEKTAAHLTAEYLLNFFGENNLDLTTVMGVCSDGEVKNTGRHNGIVRCLEKLLGVPLHWFICLIHFIELCLRHVSEKVDDSRTTGPKTGTGQIRKEIEDLDKMEAADVPVSLQRIFLLFKFRNDYFFFYRLQISFQFR